MIDISRCSVTTKNAESTQISSMINKEYEMLYLYEFETIKTILIIIPRKSEIGEKHQSV